MMNPLFLCYSITGAKLLAAVEAFAKPSAALITGKGNRYDPAFQRARELGAEVLAYVNPVGRPNSTSNPLELAAYMGDVSRVPLWGNNRSNWENTMMADTRRGSAWSNWFVDDFMVPLMAERKVNGAFIDCLGCRLWSTAGWLNWPQSERDEWTAGCVDLARRLHARRLEVNPEFLLINNNIWIDPATKIDGSEAERYVDGICIEKHPPTVVKDGNVIPSWHWNHVKRPFGQLGRRRVLIIARKEEEAKEWGTHADVTHVASVDVALGQNYKVPTPPAVSYNDTRLDELQRLRRELHEARALSAALRAERNAARAEVEELESQVQLLEERARSATISLDTSVAAIRSAAEQLRGGTP